jgi:hypothetical protein
VQHRRRTSCPRAFALWLLAALPACAQTVVLEQGGPDGGGGGGSTGLRDGSTSTDGRCFPSQGEKLPFTMQTPEVIVALDRSTAMNTEIGGGMTELSAVLNTLVSQVSGYGTLIRFGFIDFPDDLGTCPNSCCVSPLYQPPPMVSMTNTTFFEGAAYTCNTPNTNGMGSLSCPTGNQRPTATALASCASYYQMDQSMSSMSPQYVLLITDGEPSGGCGDARGDCQDAEDEVRALSSFGVETIVIDLGAQSMPGDCLHDFAAQQGANGAPYYYFTDANGLGDSFKTVADPIAADACHLTLTTPPDDPSLVSVYDGNNNQIPHDPTLGWSFDGSTTAITLNGQACQNLIGDRNDHSAGLEIFYGCGSGHGSGQSGP